MEKIKLSIPKKSEFMSTIRLTTSAISNIRRFNVDEIEDLKVVISEVCTFFINNVKNNIEPLDICYELNNKDLTVEVTDLNSGEIIQKDRTSSEMCVMIIESLTDSYNFDLENKKIIFEKCINNFE